MAGKGAVVVLDAKTGGVLALASYPPLDPSRLTGEERAKYVEELTGTPCALGSTGRSGLSARIHL